MDELSAQTVDRDRNCLFRILTVFLEDDGQYS
jgi:hypothetical protein